MAIFAWGYCRHQSLTLLRSLLEDLKPSVVSGCLPGVWQSARRAEHEGSWRIECAGKTAKFHSAAYRVGWSIKVMRESFVSPGSLESQASLSASQTFGTPPDSLHSLLFFS